MTPERWAQIEELFHRAGECDPKQRTALLDEACNGDVELRRQVEALLSVQASTSDYMQAAVLGGVDAAMFPLVGETISHYRILDGLGRGGMGLVYRAEDIKLGRQVALKFLPEESAKDPAALGRFEREARSASALEHPNICPIYEFGEHEGQPFLVMQLLEGQTLREVISAAGESKPPFAVDKLLDLAIQITEGLEAAHRHGIIHRDIKPANIFVTTLGQAKILDFGLAKLSRSGFEGEEERDSSNVTVTEKPLEPATAATPDPLLSRTGVAMGTAGYMSPEQARGEKLDARTDLFSFGLVLYEMATGQRAFKGDTGPVLHDAILKDMPAPARQLNPKLPAKLDAILRKALQKDRAARYQSAAEIHADLRSLQKSTEHRSRWWLAASSATLLLFLAGVFWIYERRHQLPQALPQPKLTQLTDNSFENRVRGGAISPDGKYLAYADLNGMYIKRVDTGEVRVIPQPDSKSVSWEIPSASWFPDSARFIANAHPANLDESAWSSQNTSIWLVSAVSGDLHKLRDNGVAWSVSPDGSVISFGSNIGKLGEREIWLMAPNGEQARKLLDTDENSSIGAPLWSPDGQRVLHIRTDESGDTLVSRDLKGGPLTTILSSSEMKRVHDGVWLRDGRLLYSVEEPASFFGNVCDFWSMRIDLQTGRPVERPRQLTHWGAFCMGAMSVSADQRQLVFVRSENHTTGYMADLTAGGTRLQNIRHFPLSESSGSVVDWTPDSKTMILGLYRSGLFGLYKQPGKQPLDSDIPEGPLVKPPDGSRNARVTPDGQWILYFGNEKTEVPSTKPEPVMRVPINGGPSQRLFVAATGSLLFCGSVRSAGCIIAERSEDRKQAIIRSLNSLSGRGRELTRLPLDPTHDDGWLTLSPDGNRIALTQTAASPIQIFTVQGKFIQEIRVKGWSNLLGYDWTLDGKGLYVDAGTRGSRVLLYVDLQGNAHRLWESPGASFEMYVRASPDARHLAIATYTTKGNMWMMENF